MSNPTYDQEKLHDYRERAAELYDLSQGVEERIEKAVEEGNLQAAREAVGELNLRTKEFEDFRETLTAAEIFLAKYNVEVIDEHTVSFVIPKDVSRIEILEEAQRLVTDRDLIWPNQLGIWIADPKFSTEAATSERICIDGHVPKSEGKSRAKQEAMVGKENLPKLEDLAVAFAVNWIATGEPLFGWHDKSFSWCYGVRAAGGALDFSRHLYEGDVDDLYSGAHVAVSSRAPHVAKASTFAYATADRLWDEAADKTVGQAENKETR